MKTLIILLFSLFLSLCLYGQKKKYPMLHVLEAPKDWRSNSFNFPLSFAPSLSYKGIEDIRFTKGWAHVKSEEFWSYVFVWYVDDNPKLNEEILQNDMETYYDGLMASIMQNENREASNIVNTLAVFHKVSNCENDLSADFIGKIQFHDAITVIKRITLNAKVETQFCPKVNKYLIFFRLSPKSYDHPIWNDLINVKSVLTCN